MILFLGTFFLSIGIVYVLHTLLFRRMSKLICYSVLFLVVFGMLATLTVHGIWLGITTLMVGVFWLKRIFRFSTIKN